MSTTPRPTSWSAPPRRVGRYMLFGEFARGGMASVHFARLVGAEGFSRVVAVKRVRSLFVDSEEHSRAIRSEARLASRIRHPNVVQTLDVVIEEGVAHVVMEYVHGATSAELFSAVRERGERVPVSVAVAIVTDALQGLHAAHEARDARGDALGIVHRDVSPQNIHVSVDGHARLLDFGIAKALDRTHATAPGVVKGKIAYMAPEQLGGASATRQVDVYGAGVVLWELLTGERLFDAETPERTAKRVLTEVAPPPSQRAPGVPPALDRVVLRATAPDPRQRYENAAEMLAALAASAVRAEPNEIGAWVERLGADDLELRAEAMKRAETAEIREAPSRGADARPRRRVRGAALVVLATIVVAGAFAAARPRATRPDAPAVAPVAATTLPPESSAEISSSPPTPSAASTPSAPAATPPAPARVGKHRASSCDPPFSIDARGTKIYKQGCLR